MKTILCLTLTLLTFVSLAFVSNSFAQDASPKYVVRVTYFYPSDREPSEALETKLDAMVKDIQQSYADEMERHGFGRKTFRLETDENGNIVKHRFKGKSTSSHYKPLFGANPAARDEFFEHFDRSEHIINLILVDGILENPDQYGVGGVGYGNSFSGNATVLIYSFDKAINSVFYRNYLKAWSTTAHELGHAFGLQHDFRDDRFVMSYGDEVVRNRLSYCAAKWLDVHRYFNTTQTDFDELPRIRRLESFASFVSPPNTVRLRFEVTHTAELHYAFMAIGAFNMVDCKPLIGNSDTIEFVTTDLVAHNRKSVRLHVIDVHGNFTSLGIPIDLTFLLPDTAPVPISIPDPILEVLIRKAIKRHGLKLAEGNPITNHEMQNLLNVSANNSQITDLTGLEHAINLQSLYISNNQIVDLTPLIELKNLRSLLINTNQITDISPLAGLKQLRQLYLGGNPIRDITPLAGLTNLHELRLGYSPLSDITHLAELTNIYILDLRHAEISDITTLAKLTDLQVLYLENNQITDVSPLAELENLKVIWLLWNQIKNKKSLFILLRKNPDVKIFLDSPSTPLLLPTSQQLPEDVNADGVVNILDLTFVASNFGEQGENIADVNGDETVNILDLVQVASAFGNTASTP